MVISPKPTLAHDLASLVEAQKSAARQIDAVSDAVEASFTAPGNPIDAAMLRLSDTVKNARDAITDAMLEVSALVGDLIRSLAVCTHALGEAYTPAPEQVAQPEAEPEILPLPAPVVLPLPTPDELPTHEDEAARLRRREARLKGYEGDPCPDCGELTLVRSGDRAACDKEGGGCGARFEPEDTPEVSKAANAPVEGGVKKPARKPAPRKAKKGGDS